MTDKTQHAQRLAELAKACGATSYTNRHYPERPVISFGPEAWGRFCEALAEQPAPVQHYCLCKDKCLQMGMSQCKGLPSPLAEQPAQQSCYCPNCEALGKELAALKAQQQEPLTIPDDVVEAAQLMQDGDYRGPLFLARKVFDWVAAHGITKGGAA